jgi:hypothetical protein
MRKFTNQVRMVTPTVKYIKGLIEELLKLGYKPDISISEGEIGFISTRITAAGDFINLSVDPNWIGDAYQIDHWNPDLFKAIAALSEGDEFFTGEWVWAKSPDGMGGEISGMANEYSIRFKNGHTYPKDMVRKATLEELTQYFTQPSVEVKQEWEPKNGEEVMAWIIEQDKYPATFITKDGAKYICRNPDGTYDGWLGVSRADNITYTRSEAEQKLTEFVGKTVLIKD